MAEPTQPARGAAPRGFRPGCPLRQEVRNTAAPFPAGPCQGGHGFLRPLRPGIHEAGNGPDPVPLQAWRRSLLYFPTGGRQTPLAVHLDAQVLRIRRTGIGSSKGDFKAIAKCSLNNELVGPVNWHGYQSALMNLHRTKFANMPFEAFRSRL